MERPDCGNARQAFTEMVENRAKRDTVKSLEFAAPLDEIVLNQPAKTRNCACQQFHNSAGQQNIA